MLDVVAGQNNTPSWCHSEKNILKRLINSISLEIYPAK